MKTLVIMGLVLALSFVPTLTTAAAANLVSVSIDCSAISPIVTPDPAQLVINQDTVRWTINANCAGKDGFASGVPIARVIAATTSLTVDTGPFTSVAGSSTAGPFTSPQGSYLYRVYVCADSSCNPCPGTGCALIVGYTQIQLASSFIGGTLAPANALALLPYVGFGSIVALGAFVVVYLRRDNNSTTK